MATIRTIPRAGELAALVAVPVLVQEAPLTAPEERRAAAASVAVTIEAMPDVLRAGVRAAGLLTVLVLWAMMRTSVRRADEAAVAAALARVPSFPLVDQFVRLVRGLALATSYEQSSSRGTVQ